jgi:sugar O-acyltransferase (sialic acid O-acetyltransferase NeuD family)
VTLYIFGISNYAKLVGHYAALLDSQSDISFVLDKEFSTGAASFDGRPIILSDNMQNSHHLKLFLAVGYRNMRNRKSIFKRFNSQNYEMPNIVCPGAYIDSTAKLGKNNFIMPGAVIEPYVSLGDNNIVWSNATICHESTIGNHNFLAANSTVGGACTIEDLCFLGFSSTVIQERHIRTESLIGASSLITCDTQAHTKYLGVPGRKSGTHKDQGIRIS